MLVHGAVLQDCFHSIDALCAGLLHLQDCHVLALSADLRDPETDENRHQCWHMYYCSLVPSEHPFVGSLRCSSLGLVIFP